jgi:hypothetical protein
MSVIPLKLGHSVVDSEDAFQKANGFEGTALLMFNLDKVQFEAGWPIQAVLWLDRGTSFNPPQRLS